MTSAARPENNNSAWIAADTPPTRLLLVRHGVTEYSLARRFAGRSDLELTELGLEQARQAADRVAELVAGSGLDALYCSPLRRTRWTAAALADRLGLPATVEDGMTETDYGEWDGYTFGELRERWPAELDRWLADPSVAPPGGESLAATERRVIRARDRILAANPGRSVAVVTHVSPIKALVRLALDAPPGAVHRMYLAPASISVIDYFPGRPADDASAGSGAAVSGGAGSDGAVSGGAVSLRSYNDTSHLDQG